MNFIGIDPDLHTLAYAVLDSSGALRKYGIVEAKGKTGATAVVEMVRALDCIGHEIYRDTPHSENFWCAVENQEIAYTARSGRNPRDLILLAQVAGAAMATLALTVTGIQRIFFPKPVEWKGSVPKQIHQARVLSHMGIDYELVGDKETGYARPTVEYLNRSPEWAKTHRGDWKHIVDAIGLARWAFEKHEQWDKFGIKP